MANQCLASLQACAMRVARLDSDGTITGGASSGYVTDQFTTLTAESEIAEGDEIEIKSACGGLCVSFKDCDRLKRLNISLELCVPDPQLHEMLAGGNTLTSGAAVGYAYPSLNEPSCPDGVSIEVWTKHVASDGSQDPTFPYIRWVFPRVYLQVGSKNFENAAMVSDFSGFALENPNWFNGPNNDWPVASTSVAQYLPVSESDVPEPACGYITLPLGS